MTKYTGISRMTKQSKESSALQLLLNFDARGLDDQIDDALDSMGIGKRDWDDEYNQQYLGWLMVHVFQDAVNIITDLRAGKSAKIEAANWLFSEDNGPFSFRTISKYLGVDSGELLEKVLEMPNVKKGIALVRH